MATIRWAATCVMGSYTPTMLFFTTTNEQVRWLPWAETSGTISFWCYRCFESPLLLWYPEEPLTHTPITNCRELTGPLHWTLVWSLLLSFIGSLSEVCVSVCKWGGDVWCLPRISNSANMDSVKSVGEEVERKELLVETEVGRATMENNMGILKTDLK